MTQYVIAPPRITTIEVFGQNGTFPVRRIYCVGRNYTAHAKEMGGDLRDPPFFFQKPTDAIVPNGSLVPYPAHTENLHYEVELVMAIGKGGMQISADLAHHHVYGLAVGIDLTRRDQQARAKEKGHPWAIAKGFDHSAPISALTPVQGALPTHGNIHLSLNGDRRQDADLSDLIWSCSEVISVLSRQYTLQPGDLIFTGTPAGVGAVAPGDQLRGEITGLQSLEIKIGPPLDAYSAGAGA